MGAAEVIVTTPLGVVRLAVAVEGASEVLSPTRSVLENGGEVLVWSDVDGLVIDALVTPVRTFVDAPTDLPATVMWGVEWRLYAPATTASITISAMLPDGAAQSWNAGDEDLSTAEFFAREWVLALGGPDEEFLSRLAGEGRQPRSWSVLRAPVEDPAQGRGLVWRLPGIEAGDAGRVHVGIAWCRTGHPRSEDAPWLAVDTSPSALRQAAGVAMRHESRRGRRGT